MTSYFLARKDLELESVVVVRGMGSLLIIYGRWLRVRLQKRL